MTMTSIRRRGNGAPPAVFGNQSSPKVPQDGFLPDSRVESIWTRILSEQKNIPDDIQFATSLDEGGWGATPTGIAVKQPERVIFWALCPNPNPRWQGKYLKHYAAISLTDWRQAEMEKWRFVGSPDPAYLVFRALARKLTEDYENWRTMN